jgi:hypothetical protein
MFGRIAFVDELDAHLVDHHQKRIEFVRGNDLVRQAFVEFLVGEISARCAQIQKRLHAEVNFFLRSGPDQG